MKKFLLLMGLLSVAGGCRDSSEYSLNACKAERPLEQVPWLKAMKREAIESRSSCGQSVEQGTYRGQPVFFSLQADTSCDGGIACDYIFQLTLLNCKGKTVRNYGAGQYDTFTKEVTNRRVLFRCS